MQYEWFENRSVFNFITIDRDHFRIGKCFTRSSVINFCTKCKITRVFVDVKNNCVEITNNETVFIFVYYRHKFHTLAMILYRWRCYGKLLRTIQQMFLNNWKMQVPRNINAGSYVIISPYRSIFLSFWAYINCAGYWLRRTFLHIDSTGLCLRFFLQLF